MDIKSRQTLFAVSLIAAPAPISPRLPPRWPGATARCPVLPMRSWTPWC
jgi:hypothetical protein